MSNKKTARAVAIAAAMSPGRDAFAPLRLRRDMRRDWSRWSAAERALVIAMAASAPLLLLAIARHALS